MMSLRDYHEPGHRRGRSAVVVLLWWLVQATVFAWSPRPLFKFRVWLLRLFGAKVGHDVKVRSSARVTYPWKVEIGDWVWIGDHAELYSLNQITIGSNCVVSQGAYLCTGTHVIDDPSFPLKTAPLTVCDGAWIAAQAFIMPGVIIGQDAVVGVRSLVTRNVDQNTVVVGQPAKFTRLRYPQKEWTRLNG